MLVVIIVGTCGYPFMEFPTEQVVIKLDNQFDDENVLNSQLILLQMRQEFLCHLSHSSCVNNFTF